MRDDCMADIELNDAVNRLNRLGIGVMQTMAGIDLLPAPHAFLYALPNAFKLVLLIDAFSFRITAGMQLDHGRARIGRSLDLLRRRVDEQADLNACRFH